MVKSSVFDAYSHHPYTVGGTHNIAPEAMPNDPNLTVSLGNISTLLKIFPRQALLSHRVRLLHALPASPSGSTSTRSPRPAT
jgi:hypothetical protein